MSISVLYILETNSLLKVNKTGEICKFSHEKKKKLGAVYILACILSGLTFVNTEMYNILVVKSLFFVYFNKVKKKGMK